MTPSGLSPIRLARVTDTLARHVEQGAAPGLAAVVCRRGVGGVEVVGTSAVGGTKPVERNSIFRIASMTKPITAVATLILIEESVLHLDDPVDELLPELANRRVVRTIDAPIDDTVPAERPIT